MKTGVIYCPNHWGLKSGKKKYSEIVSLLDDVLTDYDFVQSESVDSVERIAGMMINNGYQTVIVVGGDSALNNVVNCLMKYDPEVRDQIRLGIIPNGVVNDFASYWGLTKCTLLECVNVIKSGRIKRVDVGCIEYSDKFDKCHRRYFIDCINIGLVASLQNLRNRTRKIFGSRTLSYLSSAMLIITQRLSYNVNIKINGEEISRKIMTICVGNAMGYGQTPSAVPYNGMLDVSIVAPSQIKQFFSGLKLFLSRRILMHSDVTAFRTQKINVIGAPHAHVAVDGRSVNSIRGGYEINVVPDAINIIIPSV